MTHFTTGQSGLTLTLHPTQLPESDSFSVSDISDRRIREGEDSSELAWINKLIHTTPNGHLYFDNDLRKIIHGNEDITLVHVTLSLEDIRRSGVIYPSVGCLGATIFSAPLTSEGELHNFTRYILDKEIPEIIKNQSVHRDASLIGIKIKAVALQKQINYSFNYLLIGRLQLDIYSRIKALFNTKDDERVFTHFQNTILNDVSCARDFLNICYDYDLDNVDNELFFAHFSMAMRHVNFLGYIYFEVLSEYVQLNQVDAESINLRDRGQLNIKNFKDLVYQIAPSLYKGFDLEKFQPSIAEVISLLKNMDSERKLFKHFDEEEFEHFMKWRLAQVIRLRLLDNERVAESLDFNSRSSLLGHIVHRKIGEDKTMAPYLLPYDQERAKTIWDSWQLRNIMVVENSVMPRGEVGINPMIDVKDYEIYLLDHDDASDEVIFKEKLNVLIRPSIICNISLMGSSNNPKS